MKKREGYAEATTINRSKLLWIPLGITLSAIILITGITLYINQGFLYQQKQQEVLHLAQQFVNYIHQNTQALEEINDMLENKVRIAAQVLIHRRGELSNELLNSLAKDLDVDELHWMDPEGKILYTTVEGYLDWVPYEGHPLYDFVLGKEQELMEEIRPDAKYGVYMKYGAVKDTDGSFVQVGISAPRVMELTRSYSYPIITRELAKQEEVRYVQILNEGLKPLALAVDEAGTTPRSNGNLWEELSESQGYRMMRWRCDATGERVLDLVMPVTLKGGQQGILQLGITLEPLFQVMIRNMATALLVAFAMVVLIVWTQNQNIIKPVLALDENLKIIDVEEYEGKPLPEPPGDPFLPLIHRFNYILHQAWCYFQELKANEAELSASNEEITAAYEELTASEEELRTQYDEIQGYMDRLESLKQRYEIAIVGTGSVVWEFNIQRDKVYFSREFQRITGYLPQEEEEMSMLVERFVHPEDKTTLLEAVEALKAGELQDLDCQIRLIHQKGVEKWSMIRGRGIYDAQGNLKLINGIMLDITATKQQEQYIEHLAFHDPLTNLPNRIKFRQELEQELNQGASGAVLILDLDNFKEVNDTLGHVYGDLVLTEVANYLRGMASENLFVSRFGGDEFLLLLKNIATEEALQQQIEWLQENLNNQKIRVGENEVYLNFSMGITRFPEDSQNPDQLIMNADTAMYWVKNSGKNHYQLFFQGMLDKIKEKKAVEGILREAMGEQRLCLYYQPQVQVSTGKIYSFEALLRHRDRPISPALLISVAEDTGLIIELGRWVVQEAIRQLAQWQQQGYPLKPVAINFSAKQLKDKGFASFLKETLEAHGVAPDYLEIEMTENIMLERTEETLEFLTTLKAIGISLALDDFGTGYSSLSYLTFIPVNKIKLDKQLNDKFLGMETPGVMNHLIGLAHSLHLCVTAEGVEDLEQFNRLKAGGCDYVQGYVFSKPLPPEAIGEIYHKNFLEI